MANETVLTTLAHPTDVYSAAISAALVRASVALPLIHAEDLPSNTTVKYVNKAGNVAASTGGVSEGANYTTKSAYTRTGVSITAIKDVVSTFITVESLEFGNFNEAQMTQEIGAALARELNDEILGKASGFSNLVTAASTLTIDDLMDAAYNVRAGCKGAAAGVTLRALLGHKGAHGLRKEVIKSSASVFTIPAQISILGSQTLEPNGFVGMAAGIEIYETSGFGATGSDDRQMVFNPMNALAGMYGTLPQMLPPIWVGQGNPSFGVEVSGYVWHGCSEWNDAGGCELRSDT